MNPVLASIALAISAETLSVVSIVVSFGAVLMAFLQDPISRWHRRASLNLEIDPGEIRFVRLEDSDTNQFEGAVAVRSWVRVTHHRGFVAQGVELFVQNVWSLEDGRMAVKSFYPINLTVALRRPKVARANIFPGTDCYFELGKIRLPAKDEADVLPATRGRPYFWFDSPTRPMPSSPDLHPNQLKPGRYEFEIVLTGANVRPARQTWRLEFTDLWTPDEGSMVENLKISAS